MRYAVEQNYRVRNSRLDTRIAGEDLTVAYGDFLPSVSATGALGKRLGRSVDPKTNLYILAKAELSRTRLQYELKSRTVDFYRTGSFLGTE